MNYLTLKYLHIFCVSASFALFFIRGVWVMRSYPPAQEPWVRILPHAVDGLLVATALGMLAIAPRTLWDGNWMIVKIALVLVYVATSLGALRFAKTTFPKMVLWSCALLVFLFATTVGVLHHPLGILSIV